MKVNYLSEDIVPAYSTAINNATTREALIEAILPFEEMAEDAYIAAQRLSDTDFYEYRQATKKERRGIFSGEKAAKKFMVIWMPEKMFKASAVAEQMKVPWGLAYIRLRDLGWPK